MRMLARRWWRAQVLHGCGWRHAHGGPPVQLVCGGVCWLGLRPQCFDARHATPITTHTCLRCRRTPVCHGKTFARVRECMLAYGVFGCVQMFGDNVRVGQKSNTRVGGSTTMFWPPWFSSLLVPDWWTRPPAVSSKITSWVIGNDPLSHLVPGVS